MDVNVIRKKVQSVIGTFFKHAKNTMISLSKLLHLTMLLVIFDAMNYMRLYYSDDSFDNFYVDRALKRFWEKEEKPHLTPLRRWENREKYHYANSAKLRKNEKIALVRSAIPTLILITVMIVVRLTDTAFYKVNYI